MNYYQHHIGDYISHTRHLSLIEDLAYRRLLEVYYLHERPLNACSPDVARQIGMKDHAEEVDIVLREFFELVPDIGWVNARADKEIANYKQKTEQASNAGKASAQRRFNGRSTDVQLTNNQEPITNNQEPDNYSRTNLCDGDGTNPRALGVNPRAMTGSKAELLERFDRFWLLYPKRKSKGQALKAWIKISPNEQLLSQILAAIEQAKTSEQWAKDEGRFIPHPATWLNAKGWEDEHNPHLNGGRNGVTGQQPDKYAHLYE